MVNGDTEVYQWVIVRQNCETFVWWSQTKDEALAEFHRRGMHDEWRTLRKTKMSAGKVK